ncbi:MAG: DNA-directed RNA polymerase subunit K [Candidatus Hodarchaeota archaeon]
MSEGSKDNEIDAEEAPTDAEKAEILTNIPGVGPKTAEKLVEAGYDSLEAIVSADSTALAEAVPGLSVPKADDVIAEATKLQELVASGAIDLSGKKKSKRKKAPEPEPERHELPPAKEMDRAVPRTSLRSGLEDDKRKMGIPIGPKWLTKFERARIVGARALQISMGAPVLISMKTAPKGLFSLAESELGAGVLPMTVRRSLPTGEHEDIPLFRLLEHTRLD